MRDFLFLFGQVWYIGFPSSYRAQKKKEREEKAKAAKEKAEREREVERIARKMDEDRMRQASIRQMFEELNSISRSIPSSSTTLQPTPQQQSSWTEKATEVVKRFGDQILAPSSRDATRDYGLKKISREMCESLLQQDMSKDVASLGTGLTVARETLTLLSNSRPLLQAALTGGRVAALAGTAVAAPEIILSAAAGIAATHLASNVFYSVAKGSGSSSSGAPRTSRVTPSADSKIEYHAKKVASGEWKPCSGEWRGYYEGQAPGTDKTIYRFKPTNEKHEYEVYKKVAGKGEHWGIFRTEGERALEILEEYAKHTRRPW